MDTVTAGQADQKSKAWKSDESLAAMDHSEVHYFNRFAIS